MEEQKRENKEELQQETAEERIPDREILPQEAVFCGSLQAVILCIQDIVSAPVS